MQKRYIKSSDGLEIATYEGGDPSLPPILFIHGYLFSAGAFAMQFSGPLARTNRLLAMDLRGHGASQKPLDAARYAASAQWADDVACVLDAFNVGRAVIVGWSLGSRVTLNYAWHKGFSRIAGLNLVAATLATGSHDATAGLSPNLAGLLADDYDLRYRTTGECVVICTTPGLDDDWASRTFLDHAMAIPPQARTGARSWALSYDDTLTWIAAPTLVTHGIADPVVSLELSRSHVAAIPRAMLDVIDSAGHLPFFQNAAEYDTALQSFALNCLQA